MFLKRLEINGFKSFAQKTVFDFPTGIVSVVGPNGSGKSNIIDAIRWLLGEREAKNLRGGKIEDLIFAGTAKKPKMSQAQVSLVFDNTAGRIPVDFQEVVVTRKVSRNGVSEYFINDAEVRLKDIIDFFSKIKLGTKGMTIIGQGAGDIFVRASATERMMMVQEILGLREYQLKKHDAERKLKNTHVNLDKVRAMIEEVSPRLRMLKKQTAKWHKRSEIHEELRSIEKDFFAYKIRLLEEDRKRITAPLPELREKERQLNERRTELEKELSKLEEVSLSKSRMQELGRNRRELFDEQARHERELMRLELEQERQQKLSASASVSAHEAIQTLEETKKGLESALSLEPGGLRDAIRGILRTIEKLFAPAENKKEAERNFGQEKKEIEGHIAAAREALVRIEQEEEEISHGMERFNEQFKKVYGELEGVRARLRDASEESSKLSFEQEKNQYKKDDLRSTIESLGGSFHEFEARAHDPSFDVSFSESELADVERRMFRLRGEIASIGEIDESLLKEAEEVEAHYAYLVKESDDLSKASADLFLLIDELDEKIATDFQRSFKQVNDEFNNYFRLMFGGGSAKMKIVRKANEGGDVRSETEQMQADIEDGEGKSESETLSGIDVDLSIPQKKITSLDMLSGGEKSLVSLAVLFALISVSPPPFLVLDEVDSALDEKNSKRFSDLIQTFSKHTQFIVVTHNRVTMEAADILYGITMDEGGGSKVISLKLEDAKSTAAK